jgi:hypothetical protein
MMRAVAVAAPVLERLADRSLARWTIVGTGTSAAYFASEGFVIALTSPGVPMMPNGIALERAPERWPSVGKRVRCAPGLVDLGEGQVRWNAADPPVWDPAPSPLPDGEPADAAALLARGQAVLRVCGIRPTTDVLALADALATNGVRVADDRDGHQGVVELLAALRDRDPLAARDAAHALLGRGPGLTPEGDDLLCGAAATVARFGPAAGLEGAMLDSWLAAVCPPNARKRSSDLSATLLELAAAGRVAEPAGSVLDLGDRGWQSSLRRLLGVGSSTGRAYALAIGSAAVLLGSPAGD